MLSASYVPWLVGLSIGMAILVSYTALTLTARVAHTSGALAAAWLLGGAVAMGCGIWSMHFIGMLAFRLPIALRYDVMATAGSLALAVLTSGFALAIASRAALRLPRLASGAFVMGTGICSMHYLGMAAITVSPSIDYDLRLVAASAAIAIGASFCALWLAFHLRRGSSLIRVFARTCAAIVMGLAISGMHYTGMAAARFSVGSVCGGGVLIDSGWSAGLLAAVVLGLLAVTLVLALLDAQLSRRARQHSRSLDEANAILEFRTTHDPVTGLANRVRAVARIQAAIDEASSAGQRVAVLVIDLGGLRLINDTLGVTCGDQLLTAVAARLTRVGGNVDTVARIGGDEFLMIIAGAAGRADVDAVAREVLATFAKAFTIQAVDLHLNPSIGIAVCPDDGAEVEALLARADEAAFHATRLGGNRFQFFQSGMGRQLERRLDLENELRRALATSQFELNYQPKVDIANGRINSAEALLRWRHPDRGMIGPGEFIAVAEELSLITPIGTWALREACRQARAWQIAGLPFVRVAVNVSAVQFRDPEVVALVRDVLAENELAPDYLELELTESSVMTNAEASAQVLTELSEMGVHISIDDFGTGYSSMSYLRRFPLDKLKIDRSFIVDVAEREDAQSIVRAIAMLAHRLRLKTVAEGVETEAQRAMLELLGVDQYQGYLFCKPVPAVEFEALLRRHSEGQRDFEDEALRTHSRLASYSLPRRA